MQTWSILIGPISSTGFTASGLKGQAASGTSDERSTETVSSYRASESGKSSFQSCSLPCAFRNSRVTSSDGKMDVVAPSSAPILVMVARSGTERFLTPSPPYSRILPTPPLTESRRRICRITSLAPTHGGSLPVRFTCRIFGMVM